MKILLTGAYEYTDYQLELFKKKGHTIYYINRESEIAQNDDIPVQDIDAVICNRIFEYIDIRRFVNLKKIHAISSGINQFPIDYINENGIKLSNSRGVYSIPIAEFAVTGILNIIKHSSHFYDNKINKRWDKDRSLEELTDKKVLIIGAGDIGNEVAKRMRVFCDIVDGINRTVYSNDNFNMIYPLTQLKAIVNGYDIIVLCLALTSETKNIINDQIIDRMKQGVIFVNIARGDLVDENYLIDSVMEKRIGGAVLDVFKEEPLPDYNKLWDMDNVIITPHNSFVSNRNKERLWNIIAKEFEIF